MMRNKLYKYLLHDNHLCDTKNGFQSSNSKEHEVIQLISKMLDGFNENKYKQVIFIDLSKAFGIIDHDILLKQICMVSREKT